jgi:probable rRNA maturation factor
MTLELDYQVASNQVDLPSEQLIKNWLIAALKDRQSHAELSVRVVDEQESQTLNSQFRGKDRPTNVLSFPFEQPEGIPSDEFQHLLGDLAICAPVVKLEAKAQQKPELDHWAHMVVHGTLHLLGYDHIKDDEAEIMEQLEREILAGLNIPDPYLGDHEV